VGAANIHVLRAGEPSAPSVVLLHGWPQSALAWRHVMRLAAQDFHLLALDLPGVGRSTGDATDGSKAALARVVHGVIEALTPREVTLVGHDIGGMVTYSYLRQFIDVRRAVIMDVVVPGISPWEKVVRDPNLWHFALHAVPELPEQLVYGNQHAYFDYFYDAISVDSVAIDAQARAAYHAAYSGAAALTAGFNWYRAFPDDARDNAAETGPISAPVLYLRGEAAMRKATTGLDEYTAGLRQSGLRSVTSALVPGAGHYLAEEQPRATWRLIADFISQNSPTPRDEAGETTPPKPTPID
jgi:pimeloyl-ACP methyl ester carboxylesterase